MIPPSQHAEFALLSVESLMEHLFKAFPRESIDIEPDTPCGPGQPWKTIGDQSWTATQLMENGKVGSSWRALNKLCQTILDSKVMLNIDLSIIVKNWRICIRLHGIDKDNYKAHGMSAMEGSPRMLIVLLNYFREGIEGVYVHGKNANRHPLLQVLDVIRKIPPSQLSGALMAGYRRTIGMMESHLGGSDISVLEMQSKYFKYQGGAQIAFSHPCERYATNLRSEEQRSGKKDARTLRVHHDFVYRLYYVVKDDELTILHARKALETAKARLGQQPSWGVIAQTFTFTARSLAEISFKEKKAESCRCYLEDAIARLENGDEQCRARALMLVENPLGKFQQWGQLEQAVAWRQKRASISRRIDEEWTS